MHAKHSSTPSRTPSAIMSRGTGVPPRLQPALEDELDRAGISSLMLFAIITALKHRNMAIVPAGMHEAVVLARRRGRSFPSRRP